jgi:hypothetical protein
MLPASYSGNLLLMFEATYDAQSMTGILGMTLVTACVN